MTLAPGVLIALGGLVVVVAAVAKSLLSDEARAWLPYVSQRLIRSAARQLQDAERNRYEEEWLAELATWSDRPLSAVTRAAHIRWNAREMRASLGDVRLRGMRSKRTMDVLLGTAFFMSLAPLLVAIAVLIKLGSRPVLVRSVRVGRDGKPFTPLKFNSGGRYGAILRRTSLDELPRMFNVVRGEMSLVGPRPLMHGLERRDADLDPHIRPGLVGPAVLKARPEASYEELRRLDREYATTRSLGLDLKLLALCVVAVLRRPEPPI